MEKYLFYCFTWREIFQHCFVFCYFILEFKISVAFKLLDFYFIPFSLPSCHLKDIQRQVMDLRERDIFLIFWNLKYAQANLFKRINEFVFLNRHWHNLLLLYIDKTILRFQVVNVQFRCLDVFRYFSRITNSVTCLFNRLFILVTSLKLIKAHSSADSSRYPVGKHTFRFFKT